MKRPDKKRQAPSLAQLHTCWQQVYPAVYQACAQLKPGQLSVLERAAGQFAAADYFEVHETLEVELWLNCPHPAVKDALQGLIHLSVAAHHFSNGNAKGVSLQWQKAQNRLQALSDL